jgi:hypothetical protein
MSATRSVATRGIAAGLRLTDRLLPIESGSTSAATLLYGGVLVVAFLACIAEVRVKPLWYDELVTLHVSALSSIPRQWATLRAAADSQPIGYYVLLRAFEWLPWDSPVTIRVASIAGYLMGIAAVHAFAARWIGRSSALLAAAIYAAGLLHFATEARSYALFAGATAAAAALWQRTSTRPAFSAWLAIAALVAAASHYFGIVSVLCLMLAEAWTALKTRRWRWMNWAAFAPAVVMFFATLPVLLNFRRLLGTHFWSRATWRQIAGTYDGLAGLSGFMVVLTCGVLLFALCRPASRAAAVAAAGRIDLDSGDALLVAAIGLFPVWLVVPAVLGGSAYVGRYAIPALFSVAVGGPLLLQRIAGARATAAVAVLAAGVFAFDQAGALRDAASGAPRRDSVFDSVSRLIGKPGRDGSLPVVVASGIDYLPVAYYAPPSERARFIELADPDLAVQTIATDTVDRANELLSPIASLQLARVQSFLAQHGAFYVYAGRNPFAWLPQYLLTQPVRISLIDQDAWAFLYRVDRGGADTLPHALP